MKLIICGGRSYMLAPADFARLDALHADPNTCVSEVVSGASKGADVGGEAWALANGLPVKRFHADWLHKGRAAGPIRNAEMAAYAGPDGGCVAFPGGKGTADMVRKATAAGLRVWDWRGDAMTDQERATVAMFRERRPDLWADVPDADLLRHASAAWVDVMQDFAAIIGPWGKFADRLNRWNAAMYRAAHPETIKAAGVGAAARHKRRYQRMVARWK